MNRSTLGVGVLVLAVTAGVGVALPPPMPTPGRTPSQLREPLLKFDRTEFDFGEITDEKSVAFNFGFENTGPDPIEITEVKALCGCTTAALQKTVYQPGERGVIHASFDPTHKQGDQHRGITIRSTDKNRGFQRLNVVGYVRPIAYTSPAIVNYAQVGKGESVIQVIEVIGSSEDFEITGFELSDPEVFAAKILSNDVAEIDGQQHKRFWVETSLKGSPKAGRLSADLTFATNDERRPEVSTQLVAIVRSDLNLRSPMVNVGSLHVGDSFERELELRHTQGKPFQIESITLDGSSFEIQPVWAPIEGEPGAYRITVRGEATKAARAYPDRLIITTNLEDESALTAYFRGVTVGEDGTAPARDEHDHTGHDHADHVGHDHSVGAPAVTPVSP